MFISFSFYLLHTECFSSAQRHTFTCGKRAFRLSHHSICTMVRAGIISHITIEKRTWDWTVSTPWVFLGIIAAKRHDYSQPLFKWITQNLDQFTSKRASSLYWTRSVSARANMKRSNVPDGVTSKSQIPLMQFPSSLDILRAFQTVIAHWEPGIIKFENAVKFNEDFDGSKNEHASQLCAFGAIWNVQDATTEMFMLLLSLLLLLQPLQ